MFDNINEIFNPEQQQLKTRSMKIPTQQKLKEIQEQQEKHQIKLSKLSLLEEDENEKEEDPYLILKNYYTQIKSTVLQIQKNFIGKKKGSLNKEQTDRLYKLILSCNFVIGIILNYKPISYNKINISTFLTGQII